MKSFLGSIYITLLLLFTATPVFGEADVNAPEYQTLRDSMSAAFNRGDSTRFFLAVRACQNYLLDCGDLHGYYTQRCNEIVFLINRRNIFEAYKKAIHLSKELRERKLDSEMYMAVNMMGHIYNYCGNKEMARKCFTEALESMEREGYAEGMPSIYMNLVQVEIDDHPEEAMRLLDKAAEVAADNPRRLVDVDAYRTIVAFKNNDMDEFRAGYSRYKDALNNGYTSVHGNTLEIYEQLRQGNIDAAIHLSELRGGDTKQYGMLADIYERSGDWRRAYEVQKKRIAASDSINAVILSDNMQGISNEIELYEADRSISRQRLLMLLALAVVLLTVIVGLSIYSVIRRRHVKELRVARDHALQSDRMKSAFISNISHEIRTPLNIISGFTQVLSNPDFSMDAEERQHITAMMKRNANLITSLVDEMLDLSITDSTTKPELNDVVVCNDLCREVLNAYEELKEDTVELSLQSEVDDGYELLTNRGILRKILTALVDNAVKYTQEGEVRIVVELRPSSLVFAVEDSGCGVPPDAAERIFDRFEKLNDFKSGLGLGLTLARTLTAKLGGTLKLDTSYTHGARFVAEIPHP